MLSFDFLNYLLVYALMLTIFCYFLIITVLLGFYLIGMLVKEMFLMLFYDWTDRSVLFASWLVWIVLSWGYFIASFLLGGWYL